MTPAAEDSDELPGGVDPSGPVLGVWWLSLLGLLVAALLLLSSNLRAYGYALGATLGALALLRAVLPTARAGGLAVRGRWVDVATLLLLGAAVAVLASTLRIV
ncbi:hypothetical protein BJF86_16100 [Serinicoccus sp. CNJ-927]|uniref:DUF3017 domain-containing protein n=1 Tax=unclassified Serinicoccus TaxID=2643101 RepID=UPI00095FBBAD|nr:MULTISPECIES: DUF3017 domain-containing protein [unclassified Serinicoccus]OLT17245.1 hypothetical protein BJF80_03525 [Serinicoccus sp. CUA-874]OLT41197.1 hypothetical protein BJF86_16100 [Serinicoccus sp. CNJ-927]